MGEGKNLVSVTDDNFQKEVLEAEVPHHRGFLGLLVRSLQDDRTDLRRAFE